MGYPQLLGLCLGLLVLLSSTPLAVAHGSAISVATPFQVKYPYSVAVPSLQNEVAQCAAASGFRFGNTTPTAWQLARMCDQPSCAAVVNELLGHSGGDAPAATVSAFHWFAEPMINFCWYHRLPDEPCPANPLVDYVQHVQDKDAACARVTGASYLDPNSTSFNNAAGMYLTTLVGKCPDECTELSTRIYILYDRMSCTKFAVDEDLSLSLFQVGTQFMFSFCGFANGGVTYDYSYRPDWPIPTLPPEPTTPAPTVDDASSRSSDGSLAIDVGNTDGSDLGNDQAALGDGLTVMYRSKIPRPSNISDSNADSDSASPELTSSRDQQSRGSSNLLGVVSGSTTISTKSDAKVNSGESDSSSHVVVTDAKSSGRDYTSSIVICVSAVAVFAAFLLFVERRRKRSAVENTKLDTPQGEESDRYSFFTDPLSSFSSSSDVGSVATSRDNMMSSIWNGSGVFLRKTIPLESIKDVRLIGTGGFGVVYLVQDLRTKRLLASKRLVKNQLTTDKIAAFYDEIQLVSKLDHPSIVSYIGATWTNRSDLQALFEYMDGGDLRTHLDVTPVEPWTLEKLDIAINVADALVYVHSTLTTPIVHRDLKSRNILLSRSPLRAKLSDFGVARRLSHNQSMTTGVGTSRWLAPEVIIGGGEYDAACDIYSFGVVLSELDTHRLPFSDCSAGGAGSMLPEITILSMVGLDGLKPTFSESCPPPLLQLAQECLAYDPKQRPSAQTVAATLRRIRANLVE